ncbi:hypothetical protein KL932_003752 [Ogataea haglerorum]|nr:hypothetical protein KL932_003752 [Ogataea haglerorum]
MFDAKLFRRKHEKAKDGMVIPDSTYNMRLYRCAIFASWAAVLCGYDSGFISGTIVLDSFQEEFGLKSMSKSRVTTVKANIISLFHVGAFFGSLLIYPVNFYRGRRFGLIIASILIIAGSAIQLGANSTTGLAPLYAGRTILGVGIGGVSNIAPMYTAEIAPPSIRGRLVGLYELSWQVGGIVGYFINYGTNKHLHGDQQWRVPIAVQLIPAGIFMTGLAFIVETPRWYFQKHKIEKGIAALTYLRKLPPDDEYLKYETGNLLAEAQEAEKKVGDGLLSPIRATFTNKNLRFRLLLSTSTFVLQNTSGINAVNYYSPTLFSAIGVSGTSSALLSTGLFGVLKGVATTFWAFFLIDPLGRRQSMFIGCPICIFCLFFIGSYIKIANPSSHAELDAGGKATMAMFYIWCIAYSISVSGIPWVYSSELFDQSVRTFAQACAATSNWFWAFIFARFTGNMVNSMHAYGVFFFFGSGVVATVIIFYLFYPETSNVPVEDVGLLFTPGVPAWRAREYAMSVIEQRKIEGVEESDVEVLPTDMTKSSSISA